MNTCVYHLYSTKDAFKTYKTDSRKPAHMPYCLTIIDLSNYWHACLYKFLACLPPEILKGGGGDTPSCKHAIIFIWYQAFYSIFRELKHTSFCHALLFNETIWNNSIAWIYFIYVESWFSCPSSFNFYSNNYWLRCYKLSEMFPGFETKEGP